MRVLMLLVVVLVYSTSAIALDVTVSLDAKHEAAFQFLLDRANAKLVDEKKAPFPSLSVYVRYLLDGYVAGETKGVADEKKAAVLRKLLDAPATITTEDKALLGIN